MIDPQQALQMGLRPRRGLGWKMRRSMWGSAAFLHAGNLKPVADQAGGCTLQPRPRVQLGTPELFTLLHVRAETDDAAHTAIAPQGAANMQVLHAPRLES